MPVPSPRVQVPASVTKGALFPIKTLIDHPMETGLRRDPNGQPIPRKIINEFVCRYAGDVVFRVELHEAVSANPYIEFALRATKSGRLDFVWTEDGGAIFALKHDLVVA